MENTNITDKQKSFMQSLGLNYNDNMSKSEAAHLITKKLDEKKSSTTQKSFTPKKTDDKVSYYVSYAKDIFVALSDVLKTIKGDEAMLQNIITISSDLMALSIGLVQDARVKFESE